MANLNKKYLRALSLSIILILGCLEYSYAFKPKSSNKTKKIETVIINADQIEYDKNLEKFTANGKVELLENNQILMADKIIYYKNHDSATAIGHVIMLDDEGNVAFAEQVTLSDKLTKGLAKALKIRLINSGKFASTSAVKVNKDVTILYNSAYSACKVDGVKYPIWQLTSEKTVIDEIKESVVHRDSTLMFFGLPIIYTPYFSHPTPKAKRKTGFLVPSYFNDVKLGTGVNIPFYYNIHPQADTTTTLTLYSRQNPLLRNEFRAITEYGKFNANSSITAPKNDPSFPDRKFKGHIFLNWKRYFGNYWLFDSNYRRAYDKTFLKKYEIDNTRYYLTSDVTLDRFNENEFTSLRVMKYQDLRSTFNDMPGIGPYIESHQNIGESPFYINYNILNLSRKFNVEMERFSTTIGVKSGFKTNGGLIVSYDNNIRVDGYHSKRVPDYTLLTSNKYGGYAARMTPLASLTFRYPLYNNNIIVTPIANFSYTPNRHTSNKIPNEDSTDIELSDNNLFKTNRFPGIDRIESGFRSNYGVEVTNNFDRQETSFAFGQSFKAKRNPEIPDVSGLSSKRSDYVGLLTVKPFPEIGTFYRFRLNKDNLALNSNEITAFYNTNLINMNVTYFLVNQKSDYSLRKQKALLTSMSYNINEELRIFGDSTKLLTSRKITQDRGLVGASGGLIYNKDCINLSLSVNRNFNRDRDVLPSTNYMLKLSLKTLN